MRFYLGRKNAIDVALLGAYDLECGGGGFWCAIRLLEEKVRG